jgi:hypothetical protein
MSTIDKARDRAPPLHPLHRGGVDFIAAATLRVSGRAVQVMIRSPMPWTETGVPLALVVSALRAADERRMRRFRDSVVQLQICGVVILARRQGMFLGPWFYVSAADVFQGLRDAILAETKEHADEQARGI